MTKTPSRKLIWGFAALLAGAGLPAAADSGLGIAEARQVIADGVAEVARLAEPGAAIAVVDAGGQSLALERLDGTFAAAGAISFGKARTARPRRPVLAGGGQEREQIELPRREPR